MLPDASPAHHYTLPSLARGMRTVTGLAVPSMASFILNYFQTIVVGLSVASLDDSQLLAGVGLGSLVSNLLGFSIGLGLISVLDTLIARAAGAKNLSMATLQLTRGRIVCLLIFIPCTVAMFRSGEFLQRVGQDPIACAHSQTFVNASALGLLPNLLFTADSAFLWAFHTTTPIFVVNWVSSILQPIVCVLMVNYWGWGLWGAGFSVSVANWSRFILLQTYMHWTTSHPEASEAASISTFFACLRPAIKGLWEFIILASPSAGIIWCEWWVYEFQAIIAGWLGVQVLAAHVVLCNVEAMIYMVPMGIQQAASVLVGNSLGEGRPRMAIQYSQLCIFLGTVSGTLVCYLVITYRATLAGIYSIDPYVLNLLDSSLIILAVYHIMSELNCVLEGILLGMRLQGKAVTLKVLSMVVYQLPMAYLLSTRYGLDGIWYASISGLFIAVAAYINLLLKSSYEECAILAIKENEDSLAFELLS
jgi:multidrug resistance protein, MATE family